MWKWWSKHLHHHKIRNAMESGKCVCVCVCGGGGVKKHMSAAANLQQINIYVPQVGKKEEEAAPTCQPQQPASQPSSSSPPPAGPAVTPCLAPVTHRAPSTSLREFLQSPAQATTPIRLYTEICQWPKQTQATTHIRLSFFFYINSLIQSNNTLYPSSAFFGGGGTQSQAFSRVTFSFQHKCFRPHRQSLRSPAQAKTPVRLCREMYINGLN